MNADIKNEQQLDQLSQANDLIAEVNKSKSELLSQLDLINSGKKENQADQNK